MEITTLIVIGLGLVIHRHLTTYWQVGKLPYAHGFLLFMWIFTILYFLNFIWFFGVIIGFMLGLLTFFGVSFSTFLWPFLVPGLIRDNFKTNMEYMLDKREPSKLIYSTWPFLIIVLLVITIINFFIGGYYSITESLIAKVNGSYLKLALYTLIFIVSGNLLRIVTMTLLNKWIDLKQ